jgi:hypothetical protein
MDLEQDGEHGISLLRGTFALDLTPLSLALYKRNP